MDGYAAIQLNRKNFGSVLASLKDSPAGEARFLDACFRYPYPGDDIRVFFIRGNWKRTTTGHWDFYDSIFTEEALDEKFDTAKFKKDSKYRPKPEGEWFVIWPKKDVKGKK